MVVDKASIETFLHANVEKPEKKCAPYKNTCFKDKWSFPKMKIAR